MQMGIETYDLWNYSVPKTELSIYDLGITHEFLGWWNNFPHNDHLGWKFNGLETL